MLMTHKFFPLSMHLIFLLISVTFSMFYNISTSRSDSWMTANLLSLNTSKTEFLLIGLKQQLAKMQNCTLNTTHYARNLGFIFDEHLTFSDQISALSKSCYSHIRELRCIRPYLDFKTANTIATSIVHSKLDYCNSLYSLLYHYIPTLFSVNQASTNPELSCSCCF